MINIIFTIIFLNLYVAKLYAFVGQIVIFHILDLSATPLCSPYIQVFSSCDIFFAVTAMVKMYIARWVDGQWLFTLIYKYLRVFNISIVSFIKWRHINDYK